MRNEECARRQRLSRMWFGFVLYVLCVGEAIVTAHGAQPNCDRPSYESMRYEEDWSFLRNAACAAEPMDGLKYIPMGRRGTYLTLGGEARLRYEWFRNAGFGSEPRDSNGYWLQRYGAHADLHTAQGLRAFVQLQSSLENGRVGDPRPFDENELDVNQAFVEWSRRQSPTEYLSFRLGRQELEFGASRLITTRDNYNDRFSFDGARLEARFGVWDVGAFALRPVRSVVGSFDDSTDRDESFSALYTRNYDGLVSGATWAMFANRRSRAEARFEQGSGQEERYTLGSRLEGSKGDWSYSWEGGVQFGNFHDASIRAWYLASETSRRWPKPRFKPRLTLRADVTSGDRNKGDDVLQTFSPLFASSPYSGLAGLIGPSNTIDLAPAVTLSVTETVSLTLGAIGFWRQSESDAIYSTRTGRPQRSGTASTSRFIGSQLTIQTNWNPSPRWSVSATAAYFGPGRYLREVPPGEDVTFFTTWVNYRF